jgi:hypothetical protein
MEGTRRTRSWREQDKKRRGHQELALKCAGACGWCFFHCGDLALVFGTFLVVLQPYTLFY